MQKIKNVLLIDDDDDDNYFHQLVLQESGMIGKVYTAQSGTEALDLLIHKNLTQNLFS